MGIKYGSIHIMHKYNENLVQKIIEVYRADKKYIFGRIEDEAINTVIKSLPAEKAILVKKEMQKLLKDDISIVVHNDFISVFDENLTFENIEKKAGGISKALNLDIIYISDFDCDVLVVGLIKSGSIAACLTAGDALSAYGLKNSGFNMDLIKTQLGNDFLTDINEIDEIDKIEETVLYEWLKIPADYNADCIKQDGLEIIKQGEFYTVYRQ